MPLLLGNWLANEELAEPNLSGTHDDIPIRDFRSIYVKFVIWFWQVVETLYEPFY